MLKQLVVILFCLFVHSSLFAQVEVKLDPLSTALGNPNVSIEYGFTKGISVQLELFEEDQRMVGYLITKLFPSHNYGIDNFHFNFFILATEEYRYGGGLGMGHKHMFNRHLFIELNLGYGIRGTEPYIGTGINRGQICNTEWFGFKRLMIGYRF
jgi:hypothetical protein